MKIEASGVRAGYGSRTVLHDVSFSASGAESVVLLGPNGSGKSTLLKLLSGHLVPRSGDVMLDGVPLASLPRRKIAEKLAVLPQEPFFPSEMTVRELVLLGRYPHRGAFLPASKEDRQILDRVLERMSLTALRDRKLGALSGGERRRVRIAMALAQTPEILLLDEPAAYLDISAQAAFADLMLQLREEWKITIVLVLHDLNLAVRCASRIALMRDGRILYQGKPEEVLTPENIHAVFGVRMISAPVPGGMVYGLPPAVPRRGCIP